MRLIFSKTKNIYEKIYYSIKIILKQPSNEKNLQQPKLSTTSNHSNEAFTG